MTPHRLKTPHGKLVLVRNCVNHLSPSPLPPPASRPLSIPSPPPLRPDTAPSQPYTLSRKPLLHRLGYSTTLPPPLLRRLLGFRDGGWGLRIIVAMPMQLCMEISFQFTRSSNSNSSSSSSSRFRHPFQLLLHRKLRDRNCLLCQMQHKHQHQQQQQHPHVRNPHLGGRSWTGRPRPTVTKTYSRASLLLLVAASYSMSQVTCTSVASYSMSQVTCTSLHTANTLSSAPQPSHCKPVTRRAATWTRFFPTRFKSTFSPGR